MDAATSLSRMSDMPVAISSLFGPCPLRDREICRYTHLRAAAAGTLPGAVPAHPDHEEPIARRWPSQSVTSGALSSADVRFWSPSLRALPGINVRQQVRQA